ncbi:aldo/keto reductase [Colletotrichum cuscutae]|uniref:Aldo/keto reductase n=1 Tax=Colletotrichum cuscutae TaxID=1209917 RepID=A0AAI9U550_9PEZI|nr:aldo/keto reductase [Colletotrichum cuscutae]
MSPTLINGNPLPQILYGTARRRHKPCPDIGTALSVGYRGIDTAAGTIHHDETLDGQATSAFLLAQTNEQDSVGRGDLFLQSKYIPTPKSAHLRSTGQEQPNTEAPAILALESVMGSSTRLKVDSIDCYFVNASRTPTRTIMEIWLALEQVVDRGGIRYLGLSNVKPQKLLSVLKNSRIKPAFVQNWFCKETRYDHDVAVICKEEGIVYQLFGIFDASNSWLLDSLPVQYRAQRKHISAHEALLQQMVEETTASGWNICVLDGTTDKDHMAGNLAAVEQADNRSADKNGILLELIGWK